MRVTLFFAPYFSNMLGIDTADVELPDHASVGDAIAAFMEEHPGHRSVLEARKTFLLGDFRAIYTIVGKAVLPDHPINDGDELKVLKAFIGG
jgi:uncharacterized ubiquitin-like protein YukD